MDIEKRKRDKRKWYKKNKEYIQESRKKYRQKNNDRMRLRERKYYLLNRERIIKYKTNYDKEKDFGLILVFRSMWRRCNNPTQDNFKYYGGRGIKLLWESYPDFRKDMYKSYVRHLKKYGKKNTTIEKIDNNGNYCKKNCRWATLLEQRHNRTDSV